MRHQRYRTFAPTRLNPLLSRQFATLFSEYKLPSKPRPVTLSADRSLYREWTRQARITAALAEQSTPVRSSSPAATGSPTLRIKEIDPRGARSL